MANLRWRKAGTVALLLLPFGAMVGLVSESVTLYRLFCSATGYQGTTQRVRAELKQVVDQIVTVRFNTETSSDLPWTFTAPQSMKLKLGETGLAFFKVKNNSHQAITSRAVYNVTPDQAGRYFDKIECFCFKTQTLTPGQEAEMPVSFFVDPKILDDPDAKGVHTITLSYTFYPQEPEKRETPGSQASSQAANSSVN